MEEFSKILFIFQSYIESFLIFYLTFLYFQFYFFSFMSSTYVQLVNQARKKCPADIEASKQFQIYMSMLGSAVSNKKVKIVVLKNFAVFTGKYPCWRRFLIKLQPFYTS